jgi:P-type Ca2+ transporter type 2C
MLAGGFWSTLVNLVLIQFFKAYIVRSDRDPVVVRPFANKWLKLAIVWDLVLLAVVIYVPVLQKPFGTFCLIGQDWAIVSIGSFSVVPVI